MLENQNMTLEEVEEQIKILVKLRNFLNFTVTWKKPDEKIFFDYLFQVKYSDYACKLLVFSCIRDGSDLCDEIEVWEETFINATHEPGKLVIETQDQKIILEYPLEVNNN
jgi:hypothetical protein